MANSRKEVPENRKWNTGHIYENLALWESDYKWVESHLDFSKFKGSLGTAAGVKACLEYLDNVSLVLEKLYVYASMKHHEDTRDSTYTGLLSRAEMLFVSMSSQSAFIVPELTSLPLDLLKAYEKDESLSDYSYDIRKIIAKKPHVLSEESERLLAMGGQVFGGYHDVFGMIDNADLPFPTVKTDMGKVKVTHGVYSLLLQSANREDRKKAFKKYYAAYGGLLNTITAAYVGNVNKDVFLARAKNYSSCLEKALAGEDVEEGVYKNLLDCVHENLPLLHRYTYQKKEALGLDKMHMYDIYVPIVENAEIKLDYEDAFKLVKTGLAPLGEDYQALLQEAHDNGWIDVEETPGKRSGAYSNGVYAFKHPYVLLNYQQTTSDVFTVAHELGHAMHTYYANKSQPKNKADYTIFVAEVASTVNEVLLLKHLLANTDDLKLKKYLLSYYTDMIKGTLFRQTMFAEFEYLTHSAAEKGTPLTKDFLCSEYLKLNKKYYGKGVISDKEISWEWSRIPHFYSAFYVYKYATGIISAISIAERILSEGKPAVDAYKKFLSSGGSDSPVELLKIAGVDLTKKDAFNSAMKSFEDALNQFDSIKI